MPPPVGRNWEMFMENQVLHGPEEIDLTTVQPGDQLVVVTKNTRYEFEWLEGGSVLLRTDRTDRPCGLVILKGCAFRRSGIVVPNVVFRGGKLELSTMEGRVHHRTTVIASHTLIRQGDASALSEAGLTARVG